MHLITKLHNNAEINRELYFGSKRFVLIFETIDTFDLPIELKNTIKKLLQIPLTNKKSEYIYYFTKRKTWDYCGYYFYGCKYITQLECKHENISRQIIMKFIINNINIDKLPPQMLEETNKTYFLNKIDIAPNKNKMYDYSLYIFSRFCVWDSTTVELLIYRLNGDKQIISNNSKIMEPINIKVLKEELPDKTNDELLNNIVIAIKNDTFFIFDR